MHGRRLATLDEIVGLAAPESTKIIDIVESWAKSNDIGLTILDVGTEITDEHIEREKTTLGLSIGGDGTFVCSIPDSTDGNQLWHVSIFSSC